MRVISMGNLKQEDLTGKAFPLYSLIHTHQALESLVNEYAWSQIEPATAILCACAVTYRPLFVNLDLNHKFSKLSSSLSRSRRGRPKSDDWTDMENSRNVPMQWPVAQDFHEDESPSQGSDDEIPIFGRREPITLKPFKLPAVITAATDSADVCPLPVKPNDPSIGNGH